MTRLILSQVYSNSWADASNAVTGVDFDQVTLREFHCVGNVLIIIHCLYTVLMIYENEAYNKWLREDGRLILLRCFFQYHMIQVKWILSYNVV